MKEQTKIIIAGVGGQGVVFLTEILVDAAIRAGIPAATSEVHGLSQRGGSVVAGVTFGKNTFGFVEDCGADFLLGLEVLEAQRCLNYLNKESVAVIDNTKIFPHFVNAGKAQYPDTDKFLDFLKRNISEVIFIEEAATGVQPVMRNLAVLAKAAMHKRFPFHVKFIEQAIKENARGNPEKSLQVFRNAIHSKKSLPL
ncbi:MAG TPA: 2-oxoacid:acceptor oxidoreductase family protein [Bacteroidia bacterium]